jgi:hypothetical protein
MHRIFLDGIETDVGANATPLTVTSGTSIGKPAGYATQCAAPVFFGASRFSLGARYTGPFTATRNWSVDSSTVAQWLTTQAFDGSTLVDEAGGDNSSTSVVGFVPASCN